jgi:hypothetical protein
MGIKIRIRTLFSKKGGKRVTPESKEVIIKDKNNKYRIQIIKDENIPNILFYDNTGHLVFKLWVYQKQKRISVKTFRPNNDFEVVSTKCDTTIRNME